MGDGDKDANLCVGHGHCNRAENSHEAIKNHSARATVSS